MPPHYVEPICSMIGHQLEHCPQPAKISDFASSAVTFGKGPAWLAMQQVSNVADLDGEVVFAVTPA